MTIMEKGLASQIELIFQNPFEESPDLKAANPLSKVPTLITEDGTAIYDSRIICRYLNSLSPRSNLYPKDSKQWAVQTGEALCDGMLDALFDLVMERRRSDQQQSELWMGRWTAAFFNACEEAERTLETFEGDLTIAQIALGAALGYACFRTPDLDWRHGNDRLAKWYGRFEQRASMLATDPEVV